MSGKPYTMKEMKSIVDYLTENKAYGEVKGRKMWLEFERSKVIDRTWQSLKETFLKRILPDIHNPYYQLSITQISSFRQGYDVETKLQNKLEVRAVSEESSVNADDPENTEQPSTSNDKEVEKNSGEEKINSRNVSHHRSSDETIVLDPCYETAEDIQRDLESPNQKDIKNEDKATHAKSLRDFITYSEPLTPMLQEVIDDFATDEDGSDKESNLKISEVENNIEKTNSNSKSSDTDDVRNNVDNLSESRKNNENQNNGNESTNQNTEKSIDTPAEEIVDGENGTNQASEQMKSNISENGHVKNTKEDDPSKTENVEKIAFNNTSKNVSVRHKDKDGTSQRTSSQNLSNTTTDTLIPNNQEALNTMCESINPIKANVEPESRELKKNTRKRAISQEPTNLKEKNTYLNVTAKPAWVSDTDANIKRKKLITGSKSDWSAVHKPNLKEIKKVSDNKNKQKIDEEKNPTEEKNDRLVHSSAEGTNNKKKSEEIQNENTGDNTINSNIKNPCLKSVSLYEEQFSSIKYSGSSDEVITSTNPNPPEEKNKKPKDNHLLLLLNSEPDSPGSKKRKKGAPVRTTACKSEREKALANVFGFSSGAIAKDRKRRVSYQNRSARRQSRHRISSGSSEWTSETDTEFVSPPRGRRSKFSRKFLKPKSARILSLEDEGGLFVMYGKKIYPVIKDGKKVKNYVNYAPERDSLDEDESYWKLKYIEEKKRTAKLTKLLHQTTEHEQQSNEADVVLDLTESSPSKRTKVETYQAEAKNKIVEVPVALPKKSTEVVKESVVQDKTLIIKITKKNEAVQLEGHWSQIHPVLDQVVQIFKKESEPKNDAGSSISSERLKSRSSRLSTPDIKIPAVQEAHEKVNKLETEIFKEIESLDKQYKRSPTPTSLSTEDSNLFIDKRRRGRPKKSIQSNVSESSSPTKEKDERAVTPQMLTVEENVERSDATQIANGTIIVKRQTRTPKTVQRESTARNESNVINTRTKSLRVNQPTKKFIDDETDVLYKLPSPPSSAKKTTRKSVANKSQKGQKSRNRYNTRTEETFPSMKNQWINHVESSQGYQDSDFTPIKSVRKKKKSSMTLLYRKITNKNRRNRLRRKQYYYNEMSDTLNSSCSNWKFQLKGTENSSLNSAVYKTESYNLLMPKVSSFKHFDMREENSKNEIDLKDNTHNIKLIDVEKSNSGTSNVTEGLKTSNNITDVESSSVTLPSSPVLSIVENMSISKNMFFNIDCPKENADEHDNKEYTNNDINITNIDVSMPLIEQNFDVIAGGQHVMEPELDKIKTEPVVTDSFLNKIFAVNLRDIPSMSETVTQKLRDLFLNSAKKLSEKSTLKDNELSKINVIPHNTESTSKQRSKKRCSTPLKRHINKKTKSNKRQTDAFIEEEHTETFSQGGRKSCPPLIYNVNDTIESNINSKRGNGKKKGRKTNDKIIKVKITRPKAKKQRRKTNSEERNHQSVYESKLFDRGTNDSGFVYDRNDSPKLLHNHSETCIQKNECDSEQYVKDRGSVQSIDNSDDSFKTNNGNNSECKNTASNLRSGAIDPTSLSNANLKATREDTNSSEGNSSYMLKDKDESPNSLITEDLSDRENVETGNNLSKWYHQSDEENTNTNFVHQNDAVRSEVSCGSNLSKLYPVAGAVPNLSAVTEVSTENQNKIVDLDENS